MEDKAAEAFREYSRLDSPWIDPDRGFRSCWDVVFQRVPPSPSHRPCTGRVRIPPSRPSLSLPQKTPALYRFSSLLFFPPPPPLPPPSPPSPPTSSPCLSPSEIRRPISRSLRKDFYPPPLPFGVLDRLSSKQKNNTDHRQNLVTEPRKTLPRTMLPSLRMLKSLVFPASKKVSLAWPRPRSRC